MHRRSEDRLVGIKDFLDHLRIHLRRSPILNRIHCILHLWHRRLCIRSDHRQIPPRLHLPYRDPLRPPKLATERRKGTQPNCLRLPRQRLASSQKQRRCGLRTFLIWAEKSKRWQTWIVQQEKEAQHLEVTAGHGPASLRSLAKLFIAAW